MIMMRNGFVDAKAGSRRATEAAAHERQESELQALVRGEFSK
jgi:hypothetical protein